MWRDFYEVGDKNTWTKGYGRCGIKHPLAKKSIAFYDFKMREKGDLNHEQREKGKATN